MTFEEAIVASIRAYYKGKDPVEYNEAKGGEVKYTREYFDQLEASIDEETQPKKKAKNDVAEDDDDAA